VGGLIAAVVVLTVVLLIVLFLYLHQRRRIGQLAEQMESFLVTGQEPLKFSVQEDALAPLQNAAAELENQVLLARSQKQKERCATRDLTADISHQLKTPLASLRLFCEMDESAHVKEQLSQIERMEKLIQSLLRLERLCADGYEFTFAEHDIAALVHDSWQGLASVYPTKILKIEGNATIRCDEKWLGEAYMNLLKNACEHTPDNGEIIVHLDQSDTAFFCSVSDNGGGVDAKELPHLFERFYRAHSRETKGAGIGLSIVKKVVDLHNGRIDVQSSAQETSFTVLLPA